MGDSVLDYCGLGNIVKGVKKRKKKCNPPSGQRTYPFPNDDHLRSNESVHTLLSKLDIVEKKLEKFDQTHPLATQTQAARGMVGASQDNHCSKLKVQLPDNWLELMKDCETSGDRPCLEVSVKSETDYNCCEDPQKGATRGRRAVQTTSRNKKNSCEMARRNNFLETCCESLPKEFGCSAADSNSSQQYSPVESSGPCGESPDIISPSEGLKYSTFAPPCSTRISSRNNIQVTPGGGESIEAAPKVSPCDATSESSVFAHLVCNTQKPLSNREPVILMESGCEEINLDADYPNNQSYVTDMGLITSISSIAREPKRAEVQFDSEYRHNQKSPCTYGCCPSYTLGCGLEQNASYTLGFGPHPGSLCASRCRDQQLSCPSCRVVPPTSCLDGPEQNMSYPSGYGPPPSSSRCDQQLSCPSCREVPPTSCLDRPEQNMSYTLGYDPPPSSSWCRDQQLSCPSCRVVPPTSYCQNSSEQNTAYTSGYGPYPSSPSASRCCDQQLSCPSCRVVPPTSCCRDVSAQNEMNSCTSTSALPSMVRKDNPPCKTCSPSRNIKRVLKLVPPQKSNKSDGADMRIDASTNCYCAQAIGMIQNCSKHKGQRQPRQKLYQSGIDESACHETCSVCCGSCESQFRTLVVNIPRAPIVTSSPADVKSGVETRNCETQGSDRGESGRIAPIKSCECDIIKETSRISKSSPNNPKSTPPPQKHENVNGSERFSPKQSTHSSNSQKEQSKQCSSPRSVERSPQRPHHENVDSSNNAALDNKKVSVASRRGSRPSKDSVCPHGFKSTPEEHGSPHDENMDSTNDATLDNKKVSVASPRGSRPSKDSVCPHGHKSTPEEHGSPRDENVDSTNDAALDNKKVSVASRRGSRPSKDSVCPHGRKSTPEDHGSPRDENMDSTNDAALDNKKASTHNPESTPDEQDHENPHNKNRTNDAALDHKKDPSPKGSRSGPSPKGSRSGPSPKGSRLSKDNAENPTPDGKTDSSLFIKDGVEFEGKGESQSPINPSDNNRVNFTAPGLPPAPLLLSSPRGRRGFLPLPLSVAPSNINVDNNTMECDFRSCSIRLPQTNVKRDLFISEGTVLTSHPSNISAHNEYNGVDDTVSKVASPSRSSPQKAREVEDSKASSADVADMRNSNEPDESEDTMEKPCKRLREDSANPGTIDVKAKLMSTNHHPTAPQKHQNNPSNKHKPKDHSEAKQCKGEQHWYENKTKKKEANLKPAEQMRDGKAKCSEGGSSNQYGPSTSASRNGPTDLAAYIGKQRGMTEKRWEMLNEEMKSKSQQSRGRRVSFHKGSIPEAGRRARKRACNRMKHLVRSNSLNSEKYVRVDDSERQRIHKLARKSILKCSPTRSVEAQSCISPSYHGNDTQSSNHAIPPAEVSCFPVPAQLANRESTNLNEKYLKELMLPFAHQGADRSEHEEPGTRKHVQKFVVERIIRINPRTQEMSQFTELTASEEEEEEFVPENTDQLPNSLKPFIGSKPEISGTSTSPTCFAQPTVSQPSYTSGAVGPRGVSSNRVSDIIRETLIRFYTTDEEDRSEHNLGDLLFHRLTNYDDPTDQPCDVFEDAFAGNKQKSSGGRSRKYERMEEFLRDSMLKSLYSQLQRKASGSRDDARDGFQNQASSMIFHQDTKRITTAPRELLASSCTEEHHQDNPHSSAEVLLDAPQNPYDPFNDKLKELIWNSQFTPSDTPESDKTVYVPDSQLVMALRVNSETRSDQNVVHQKSYSNLQKASAIMDLLEIFPGQHRHEDPQEEKTRKWIEKIHRKLENEKERVDYEKTIRAKVKKSRKRDYYSQKISSARFSKKGCATSRGREAVNKKYHVPVQAEQSSSSVSMCDLSSEPGEGDREEQRFLVYMNESGHLSKERCKHGVSNRLPKEPTHWFRGTGRNGYSTVVQRISYAPSTDSRSLLTEHQPVRNRQHTHRPHHHRHHHKQRGSSDDSLNSKRKSTRKKEIIVKKPKKKEALERQYREVRASRRSVSVSSSSDSSVHKERRAHKVRHSYENDKKTMYTHDHGRHNNHRHSLDESHYGGKYEERRSSKTKRTSVDGSKQNNDQPKKSAMKKSNLKSVSSASFHESDTSSSDSSSYTSIPSRRVHHSHDRPVKHSTNQTARHLKVSHSPLPVKRVKVNKKVPNVLHNHRQRLITPDSKSSVGYEKVNVKDFIDFLATLSRNTISTLTNKKKALKLYRSYLSSPKRR